MNLKRKGFNLVISAPSGVGKSTIIQELLKDSKDKLTFSISATTRPMRDKEINGVNYYFKTKEEFYELIKNNSFIEYAEVFGNFYGTLVDDVKNKLESGKDIVFDLDWQGATVLKSKMPEDTISIFILPPSISELERRIRGRKTDNEDVILYRMAKSRAEISHYNEYDYLVINDDLSKAIADIKAIIEANRFRKDKFLNIEEFVSNL
jgi:guanylate kinase